MTSSLPKPSSFYYTFEIYTTIFWQTLTTHLSNVIPLVLSWLEEKYPLVVERKVTIQCAEA